jgi:hypothetical protein
MEMMTMIIGNTMDFNLLGMPSDIAGKVPLPPTPATTPAKRPREPAQKGGYKQTTSKKGGSYEKEDPKYSMTVHLIINVKLTPFVPQGCALAKFMNINNIKSVRDIFPNTTICVNGAIKGYCCPFQNRPHIHDGSKVTDDMAKTVVSLTTKVIQNPALLQNQYQRS